MRRARHLRPRIACSQALLAAYHRASRGKRYTAACLDSSRDLEGNLLGLLRELEEGTYRPGPYRTFTVYEPKTRLISAAPFHDRAVHHASYAAVAPVLEASFIPDSYTTRVGKGTHRCLVRFHDFLRRSRYVLKLDVEKYLPSIDHAILKELQRCRTKCQRTLALMDAVIDSSDPQEPRDLHFPGDDLLTPSNGGAGSPSAT